MPILKNENTFLNRIQQISLEPFEESKFWTINLNEIHEEEISEAVEFIDQESFNHAQRFIFVEDQYRAIIAHAALRFCLGLFVNQKPSQIKIDRSAFNKPFLRHYPLHFSLSHTKLYAFIGFHFHKPIGVDVEMVQDRSDFLHVAKTFMHPSEYKVLESSANPCDCFYDFWCGKEALLKAKGTGFLAEALPEMKQVSLSSLSVQLFSSENLLIYTYREKINNHKIAVCVLP